MNTVTITGNLTDTPSSGSTGAGTKYCRLSLAVSRKVRKDGSWEDKLDGYFKVVAWRTLAESCSKLEKGTRVQISGSLQQRGWLSDDGIKNQVIEIVADDISLPLTRKKAESNEEAAQRFVQSESPPSGAGFSRRKVSADAPILSVESTNCLSNQSIRARLLSWAFRFRSCVHSSVSPRREAS